ncbi:DNA-directed RNA polymerase subunit beta [Virgibacillus sediminis]|uniref:DNA-directed RNA polymerase subunit beta n=1 Tax=Virgibacillus sediminis TaxID=202260 RepID=A0ABV7A7U2_9BACI
MSNNQSEQQSRKAYKKSKKNQSAKPATDATSRKEWKEQKQEESLASFQRRRRAFPIWLRVIVVILLAAMALIVGLMIGYSVLGDGHPMEILRKDTWQHIYEIVFQGTN